MNDPNSAIPEEATPALWRRYEEWRGRRHQEFNDKNAHRLTSWRTRRTYRRLVLVQAFFAILLILSSILAFFDTGIFLVPFLIGLAGIITTLYLTRIVTGSIADTPVTALDEIQVAQRNSARSIGFTVLYSLMFIPYAVLVVLSFDDQVSGQAVYGSAILLITLVLAAICVPTMLTAWWMADPDPEDFASSTSDPTTIPSEESAQ
ncbi:MULTISPECIES: hypothetical protein [unclassified Gordonia (in: high G+C Gram-positive bacteria)]|uniref:hypothetical protein n=1 Tax=unclassified Gordonia (in: high G+C Gram-positive bacteria) TaxID=2657482 RepID=UPI00080E6750|nr:MULTISPECIES: hypothetical protein [unclassified Gordonia (in: high G+C Gram-positive bacteria)]MBN0973168.1 hypothetical protein [Gordonia sp. BP-119]MBN0983201.1 hypothetical protein [Gordonia sp. BP-94]MCX2755611.1 hypothetical protein [Gordonia sp. 4N]OCH81221.1 hypothetical protein A9310_18585 [Gordonia sp. UCD-TK1]